MMDDFLIADQVRDKAWEAFIHRKDVKEFFAQDPEFKFPLERGWYLVWAIAWEKGYAAAVKNCMKEVK